MKILYSIADCRPVADASLTGLGVSLYRLTEFFVLEFFEFFDGIRVFLLTMSLGGRIQLNSLK